MAERRSLYSKIVLSETVDRLSPWGQLFFTWSIPHADDIGLLPRSAKILKGKVFPLKDNLDSLKVEALIKECVREGLMLEVKHEGREYLMIRNFMEHQTLRKNRQPQTILEIPLNKEPQVSWEFLEKLLADIRSASGLPVVDQRQSEVKRREEKRSEEKRSSPHSKRGDARKVKLIFEDKDFELATLLAQLIQKNTPAWVMKSEVSQWASEINKLHRIDGRTYEQIELMIRWVQQDSFWKKNILSAAKLREKFNDLIPKLQAVAQETKTQEIIGLKKK